MEKTARGPGRPADGSKIAIYCRVDKDAVASLDRIAGTMDPQPSRAQLIDRAVREFVERQSGKKGR